MDMSENRRKILKLAAALPVSLPVVDVLADSQTGQLLVYPVSKQPHAGGTLTGALVLVDSDVKQFQGKGYYLYPDWGNPVVYEVRQTGKLLAFHYPGAEKALWTMSHNHPQAVFSGRVEGVVSVSEDRANLEPFIAAGSLPVLEVPRYAPA